MLVGLSSMGESTIRTSSLFKGFAVFFSLSRLAYLLQLKMRTQVTPNMKRQFNTIFLMDSCY